MIPVLANHDHTKIIGWAQMRGSSLHVRLERPMSKEQIFATFGNCGIRAHDAVVLGALTNDQFRDWSCTEFEILEFSFGPTA